MIDWVIPILVGIFSSLVASVIVSLLKKNTKLIVMIAIVFLLGGIGVTRLIYNGSEDVYITSINGESFAPQRTYYVGYRVDVEGYFSKSSSNGYLVVKPINDRFWYIQSPAPLPHTGVNNRSWIGNAYLGTPNSGICDTFLVFDVITKDEYVPEQRLEREPKGIKSSKIIAKREPLDIRPPEPLSSINIIYTDQPLTIDGNLDEDVWSDARPLTYAVHPKVKDFTRVIVRLLWDDRYLYAGFDVSDTHVEGSTATPWDGDSVSLIIDNGGRIQEYRHSLLTDRAGNVRSSYQLKGKTTFNEKSDCDEGYIIEMKIPWSTKPVAGTSIAADFLSIDHDLNPGSRYDDPGTIFSKISWDGDDNVTTAERSIRLVLR